jgi:hypothetical protein
MRGVVAAWLKRWWSGGAFHGNASPARPDAETARGLCATLDRAMRLGLWDHAERIAASAERLVPRHRNLAERVARLRLAQHRPHEALRLIDHLRHHSASLKLLHVAGLMLTGRQAEAHLILHEWAPRSSAPLQARVLLALLENHAGDTARATDVLLRNLRQIDDPRTLLALTLCCAANGRRAQAEHWARRLRTSPAPRAMRDDHHVILRSLRLAGPPVRTSLPCEAQVASLAEELIVHEEVLASLVLAQRLEPDEADARLLQASIVAALPRLLDLPAAHEALTDLSIVLHRLESGATASAIAVAEPVLPHALIEPRDVLARIGVADDNLTMEEAA